MQRSLGAASNDSHGTLGIKARAPSPIIKGFLATPPQSYPPQEIAGLIKGLLTIGFP